MELQMLHVHWVELPISVPREDDFNKMSDNCDGKKMK